jgi:hypothetical protein
MHDAISDPLLTQSSVTNETVTITVKRKTILSFEPDGGDTFYLHEKILCASSEYFRTITRLQWTDLESKPIILNSENPFVFKSYVQWLYTQRIVYGASDFTKTEKWIHLANSYVLGERLIDRRYQNAVLDTILSYCMERDTFPSNAVIRIIYNGTPSSSPARRLLVDFWACEATTSWSGLGRLIKATCPEFVEDLVSALILRRSRPSKDTSRPWRNRPELYHITSSENEGDSSTTITEV